MRVTCERCQTEYRFDDARITEAGVRVKCTRCDHVFLVRRKSFVVTEAVPVSVAEREALDAASGQATAESSDKGKHRRWLIRRADGELLEFKEMTTLQRWIVERRVVRADEISHNGERWKRLGSIPELETFFAVIEATPANLDDEASIAVAQELERERDTAKSLGALDPPHPQQASTGIARVATVPNPQTPPDTIEERTPAPTPAPPDAVAGTYSHSGTGGDYQPTGSREPVDPREDTVVRDPGWAQQQASLDRPGVPEPRETPELPPRKKSRGRRFLLLGLLLVLGGGTYAYMQPDRARELWLQARSQVTGLIARVTLPAEALQASNKGRALLREDAETAYLEAEAEYRAALSLAKSRPFAPAAAGLAEALALHDLLKETNKHSAEVARYAQEALAADPSLSASHRADAYRSLLKKDFEAADAAIVHALARDPKDSDAHTLRATIYLEAGDRTEDARDSLRQALSTDPNSPRANYLMALMLVEAGEIPEAKPFASKAAAASPRNKRAKALLRRILGGGQPTVTPTPTAIVEVTPTATRPPSINSLTVDQLVQRGYRSFERGRYREAIRYYEKAVDKAPDNSEAYALLGLAYLKNGQVGPAESYLLGARNLNPRYADTYRYLGMLYATRGEDDVAIENFRKYLGMRPDGSGADDVRRRLAALEGP